MFGRGVKERMQPLKTKSELYKTIKCCIVRICMCTCGTCILVHVHVACTYIVRHQKI
jgi:hypothetical protein